MITEETLRRLVEAFYAKVRLDPLIGPVFNEAVDNWPEHLDTLQAFWSSVMLTSGRYKGKPLLAHLKHSDRIAAPAFDRWLMLWKDSTEDLLPREDAAALQQKAARIAESLSLGLAFDRNREGALAVAAATRT